MAKDDRGEATGRMKAAFEMIGVGVEWPLYSWRGVGFAQRKTQTQESAERAASAHGAAALAARVADGGGRAAW